MGLEVTDRGTLVFDGVAVGRFHADETRLVLNLGWFDAAGLKITVEGDPTNDRRRIVLARPIDTVRHEPHGDQEALPGIGVKEAAGLTTEKVGGVEVPRRSPDAETVGSV